MNTLTAKFLAYRAKPKAAKVEPQAPAKYPRGLYPTDGYLSNAETREERLARLNAAQFDGYEFRELDAMFLAEHWRWFEKKMKTGRRNSYNRLKRGKRIKGPWAISTGIHN